MKLHESSLQRILQYVNHPTTTLTVVSAYLEPERLKAAEQLPTLLSKRETLIINKRRQDDLKRDARTKGYGFVEVNSGWAYDDSPGFHEEKALFIPNMNKDEAIALCNKYNQDSVLFKDSGGLVLMDGSGKEIMEFGKPEKLR